MSTLDRLGGLLAQATPGPWEAEGMNINAAAELLTNSRSRTIAQTGITHGLLSWLVSRERAEGDAVLICAAVNALPALLACARELRHHECDRHVQSADEGTAYCRACAALSQLDPGDDA